jgi:hypothetical protein
MTFYAKYQKLLPTDMVSLLLLWDELGIPHEEHKQVYRSPLPVIGFEVDPNLIKITLKEESKMVLVAEIREFARYKSKRSVISQILDLSYSQIYGLILRLES